MVCFRDEDAVLHSRRFKNCFLRKGTARYGRYRCAHAYSLYDTLVSLTVAGTLAATGIPAFQQIVSSQRLTVAANELLTAINLARSEAIKRGERAVLCPSRNGSRCLPANEHHTPWQQGYLLYMDSNASRELDADEPVLMIFEPPPGVSIHSSRYRDQLSYLPSGLAPGSNLTFTLCPDRGRGSGRKVVVSNTGRPRVTMIRDCA